MTNFQVGAQLYSIRDRTQSKGEYLEALKALAAMGYNICQVSGQSRGIPFPEIREMMDEAGLAPIATHIPFEDLTDRLEEVIRNHKALRCEYPGVGSIPEKYRGSADGFIAFAREIGAIAERLEEEGMHLLYHNHNFEFERFKDVNKTGMELLIEYAPRALQFELDVFWVQAAGASPTEWIERVRGRMDVVHFKEMTCAPGLAVKMAPIGEGNMNWIDIMAACESTKVKYAFIEQDDAVETDSLECMRVSIDNLKPLGAKF